MGVRQATLACSFAPCTAFSTLQNFTLEKRDAKDIQRMMTEAIQHLSFAVFIGLKQAGEGRMFAFEHPAGASSWQLALVDRLLRLDGAES